MLADGAVDCWGYGHDGQLGNGQAQDRSVPTPVTGLVNVEEVALAEQSTCARLRDGTVSCWGANDHGQLGDGTHQTLGTPARVPNLSHVVQLASGSAHVCARMGDGTVRCWGNNEDGQLGDGTTTDRTSPTLVKGLHDAAQLAVGAAHSCVRTTTGAVRCWGTNAMAQLGDPARSFHTSSRLPAIVPKLNGVIDLAAGASHTCARRTSGEVACWGWDEECQLGFVATERCVAGTPCTTAPTAVPGLTDVAELSLSAMHSCARHTTGTITCWGDDPRHFLPNNTIDNRVARLCKPTAVPTIREAAQISLYWGGTCAVLTDHTVSCWGSNWFGELGDGTTRAHADPAPVMR